MTIQQYAIEVLKSPVFWSALLVFKNALVAWVGPAIPGEVNDAFDKLLLAVVGIISGFSIKQARDLKIAQAGK